MDDPRTTQALRELAEMYLSPKNPSPQRDAPAPSSLRLTPDSTPDDAPTPSPTSGGAPELLIAGHLPGPATLWINQYAQRLTQTHASVAALRLTEDDIALDFFSPPDSPDAPEVPLDDLHHATLPETINALAPHTAHWLLHPSHPTDPLARAAAHQTRQWTLLSGCDEAAVVAGYRLLKQLLEGRPDDSPLPQLGVMFLGCDEHDVRIAHQRLARTAREHLGIVPAMIGCQQQMLPVRRKRLGHYPLDTDPAELLTTLTDLPFAARGFAAAKPAPSPSPVETPPAPQPAHRASPVASSLCSYLPALHPLQARAPRHPHIEFALDAAGTLHLLATGSSTDIIAELLAAKLWAVEHLPLLALTVPDLKFDAASAPIQHIFTERAKHFGPLAHAGPSDSPPFKLHLLLPVTVRLPGADSTTYTSVELN